MISIAIVGAGASGMTAAIEAARCGAEVVLFEKNDRVGKKLLATGNGKCNLSNLSFDLEQYYCKDKLKLHNLFQQFSVSQTISFFEGLGLMLRDRNGYLYPYSEQASAVLDALRMELQKQGIKIISESEIIAVTYNDNKNTFEMTSASGERFSYQKVILACGSPASQKSNDGFTGYELAKRLGHKVNKVVPGLVQLKSEEAFIRALAGVRCQAAVNLVINGRVEAVECGELQFTEYGVSGIPVFQISRIAAYALEAKKQVQVCVNFFPQQTQTEFNKMIEERYNAQMDKTIEQFLTGTVNKKINMVMIKQAGLRPETRTTDISKKGVLKLMQQYRDFKIPISRTNTIEKAQICAGGVDFMQVSNCMESEIRKGLYFTGEMLDVDGKCGGYNLQWAWTSGYIAGRNAAGASQTDLTGAEQNKQRGWLKEYAEN